MQKFEFLRQSLLGELAMSRKKKERRKKERKNAIYSGHLRFCVQPMGSACTLLGPIISLVIQLFINLFSEIDKFPNSLTKRVSYCLFWKSGVW